MAKKDKLIEQAKSLGIDTEGLTVAQLEEAIKAVSNDDASNGGDDSNDDASKGGDDASEEEGEEEEEEEVEVEDNLTVKRQKAANALRKKKAAELAKSKKEEAKKEADAKSTSEKASSKKEVKDTRKRYKDDRGLLFSFKYNAPKSLNIDGKSRNTSEIIEDKEIMQELVYGNSNFIEQIH